MLKQSATNGLKLNARSYNVLLNAYSEAGRVEECKKVLKEMQTRPDSYTYLAVLNAYVNASKIDTAMPPHVTAKDALQVWDQMLDSGVAPITPAMNAL